MKVIDNGNLIRFEERLSSEELSVVYGSGDVKIPPVCPSYVVSVIDPDPIPCLIDLCGAQGCGVQG